MVFVAKPLLIMNVQIRAMELPAAKVFAVQVCALKGIAAAILIAALERFVLTIYASPHLVVVQAKCAL